ncbi:MAG: ABC transporter permease [Mizugakiibacter sp.]|uniref:ABC transporter permease n=1 Tax=Mizugakiibacter sp. TaxID=1972610 RepID=UPI0031BE0E73|nr:ABC transporter permease [Xanthomonadaceae bacterium]
MTPIAKPPAPDAPPRGSADVFAGDGAPRGLRRASSYAAKVFAIARMETRKLRHDPTELLTRAIQPVLWLAVFGQVFAHTHAIPTGALGYVDFLAPGVLAQSVLFVAIFYGISVIWERDLGIVHKFLASPTPRTALVLGKATSAGVRALSQALIVYLLALALGVRVQVASSSVAGVTALVLLGAALFATFSLIVACLVKTRERFMGVGQVLTMPLFFASNAIYPIAMMPPWLQRLAHANPLTYEVDGLRALMLAGGSSAFGLPLDFAVLLATLAVLVSIAGRLYPHIVT